MMNLSIPEFLDEAADFYGIKQRDIMGRSRRISVTRPRQVCMYLIREFCHWSFDEIGDYFNRDHATVMWACKSVRNQAESDSDLREQLEYLRRTIRQRIYGDNVAIKVKVGA